MAFEGHLCMTRIGIPTFLSKSTMQKDRVKSGDLHPWNLTNWYPTSADAEGVTFSKPGLLSMLDFQRVIPAWTFFYLQYWILASIRNTLVCCHHIIYCIYIYIVLVVGFSEFLKHPIGMCVDQFQFLHLQCLMLPSLSQSSNQKWMWFHQGMTILD